MNLFTTLSRAILFTIGMGAGLTVTAQPTNVIRVKNGKDATKTVASKDRFQFNGFQPGRLYFSNGKYADARLNYDYLTGEVMYIDSKADTLLIASVNMVDHAEIGQKIFHSDPGNGYMEVLEACGNVTLARKIQYKVGGNEKKGAYNNQGDLGAISNAVSYTDPVTGLSTAIPANNTVLLRPVKFYYFIDMNNRSYKPTKSSLIKIFSKDKEAIEKYIYEENINFNNEEDLKKAVRFCSEQDLQNLN